MTITPDMQAAKWLAHHSVVTPLFKPDTQAVHDLEFRFACAGSAYHHPTKETSRETIVSTLPAELFSDASGNLPVSVNNGTSTTVLKNMSADGMSSSSALLVKECPTVDAFDKLTIGDVTSLGCGEDSLVASTQLLGLADGVSGWNDTNDGHASLWSRVVLHRILTHYATNYNQGMEVGDKAHNLRVLDEAYTETKQILDEHHETGSSTLILASLNEAKETLQVLNIGDSSIYVIRDGQVVFTAAAADAASESSSPVVAADAAVEVEPKVEIKNCPQQFGTNSTQLPSAISRVYSFPIQEGDLVLMCSDGVSDNLWENEITETLSEVLEKEENEQMTVTEKLQVAADLLARRATDRSFDGFAVCPYHVKSSHSPSGGKNDDISVLLARVGYSF